MYDMVTATSWNCVTMEHPQFLLLKITYTWHHLDGEVLMYVFLTRIVKNTCYKTRNTKSKIIGVANYTSCKMRLLDLEFLLLVGHC